MRLDRAVPFSIEVSDEELDDLKRRILATRWPIEPKSTPWRYGADLQYLKHVQEHWAHRFDWRHWERRLNSLQNYRAEIDGIKVHFIVEQGSGPCPTPLMIVHGWPGSFVEFLDVIDRLAHPEKYGGAVEDAFTVIVPGLPGFGFSDAPDAPITPKAMAGILSRLMVDVLGVERYFLQAGDWGAIVASWMALSYKKGIAGMHLNAPGLAGGHARPEPASEELAAEERAWMAADHAYRPKYFAYQAIQGTEPQTIAYAMTDSPMGLAAWMLHRFQAWTVRDSAEPPPYDLDHLLCNVMIYWLNGLNASNWLYVSLFEGTAKNVPPGEKITVPTGFIFCPQDIVLAPPNRWIDRVFANRIRRRNAPKGGHFLAFEQPREYVEEVTDFFSTLR